MHNNNFYISFGVWLIVIPLLGVPIVWRDTLVFLSGLFLILVSLGPAILKKLQPKSRQKKKQTDNNIQNSNIKSDELKFAGIVTEVENKI